MDRGIGVIVALAIVVFNLSTTTEGNKLVKKQVDECPSNTFPCSKDCCERELKFCNVKEERCSYCEDRHALCGTDSMPLECLLYCYKRQGRDRPACLSVATVITIGTAPAVILSVAIALAAIIICQHLKRKPPDQWPTFFKKLLIHPKSQENGDNISQKTDSSLLLSTPEGEHDDFPKDPGQYNESGRMEEDVEVGEVATIRELDGEDEGERPPLASHRVDQSPQGSRERTANDSARPATGAENPYQVSGGSSPLVASAVPDVYANENHSAGGARGAGSGNHTRPPPTADLPRFFMGMNPTSEDANPAKKPLALNPDNPTKMYF